MGHGLRARWPDHSKTASPENLGLNCELRDPAAEKDNDLTVTNFCGDRAGVILQL
jgi:hypothetical protein